MKKRRQKAQRSFHESPWAVLIFREGWKRGLSFPLHPGPELLAISTSAYSETSAVKVFLLMETGLRVPLE
jgi:hypothetical protein